MRVKIIGLGSELFFSICSRWHLGDTMVTLEKHPKGKKLYQYLAFIFCGLSNVYIVMCSNQTMRIR
jgi:hypothetical protein